ncbi:class II aldolase/adducin family protein [Agrobacterium rubi]|uniref:class II aldolase/adducin family protein n=1 Tax=Agrobacterium rubi TaxID=28099 RepID=UPI001572489A|nr:class II aldolase/adducin family protein [Agrobacterium rubi]NTF09587.1 class II aldolase/adducin family protein [Agrobacterium rubi]NTF22494.1 class II aldolase/adducin family protein [Agrobacterium rubi]NTF29351.1 class II aldolase/adducin family protein [Agrobacterium rubi]
MTRFKAVRQDITDMCRYLADHGYFAGTGGNIGVRVDDDLMAVTPSATDYYGMGPEDVPVLRLDTLEVVEGDKTPTVEKGLHSRMLRMHPSRRASIHTHQPIASAVALLHEVLPWIQGSDLNLFGPHVAVIPYRPSGTGMLAKAFEKAMRPNIYAYLMASHGVICSGDNLKTAASMIRRIEASAAVHLRNRITQRTSLDKQLQAFLVNVLDKAELKGA